MIVARRTVLAALITALASGKTEEAAVTHVAAQLGIAEEAVRDVIDSGSCVEPLA